MAIPPVTLTEDEETERLYAALGKAMTQWQGVEGALALLFCDTVSPQNYALANTAYHSILSFDAKLGMTHAAILVAYKEINDALNEWTPLHNRASRRNDRRNQLAHFALGIDRTKRPGFRVHLRPNIMDMRTSRRWGRQFPRITICQIIASGNAFDKLAEQIRQFFVRWPFSLTMPPEESP